MINSTITGKLAGVILLVLGYGLAAAQDIPSGIIQAVTVDASDPEVVYASGASYIYKSTDAGATWTAAPSFADVWSIAVERYDPAASPAPTPVAYGASNGNGVLRTTDGLQWNVTNGTSGVFGTVTIHPTEATVYAGGEDGIYVSSDHGANWSSLSTLPGEDEINGLVVDPSNPLNMYATKWRDGIFRSTDGGNSWTLAAGFYDTQLFDLDIHPTNPSVLFASTWSGVYRSVDAGTNWAQTTSPKRVSELAIDAMNPDVMLAVTGGNGIGKSTDGGETWRSVTDGLGDVVHFASVAIAPNGSGRAYAGSQNSILFISNDLGESWVPVDGSTPTPPPGGTTPPPPAPTPDPTTLTIDIIDRNGGRVELGEQAKFDVVVRNTGSTTAVNTFVGLSWTQPSQGSAGKRWTASWPGEACDSQNNDCNLGTLSPGGQVTISVIGYTSSDWVEDFRLDASVGAENAPGVSDQQTVDIFRTIATIEAGGSGGGGSMGLLTVLLLILTRLAASFPKKALLNPEVKIHALTGVVACLLIAGCGGGGGDSTPPPVITPPPPQLAADEAQTTEGVIRGTIDGDLKIFRGVRYADLPTGALRFSPPAPPESFSGTRDAKNTDIACIQPSGPGTITGTEDCLVLNIWAHNDNVTRPVIVFHHGGGANGVSGNGATVDGATLAREGDVTVVTVNRRLGALGYLAIDELIADSPLATAGNFAILDAIAALEWLQDNIAAFNGDPAKIMLAGQSAGGAVVCGVLSSPRAMGLFNSAALQSAGCRSISVLNAAVGVPTDREYAATAHRELVAYLGCDVSGDVLACLRNLPASDIVLAQEELDIDFGTVIDGIVVANQPKESLAAEVAGNVPVIIGSNADEATNIFGPTPVADDAEYRATLDFIFDKPLSDDLYAMYPTADFGSASEAFLTLFSDTLFNCIAETLADSAENGAPVYFYNFARGFDNGRSAGLGAFHTIDVAHLFGSFDVWGYTPDAQALDLSAAMRNAWVGLASDPTAPPPYLPAGASAWPAYFGTNKQIVQFGDVIDIATEHRAGRCPALLTLFASQ